MTVREAAAIADGRLDLSTLEVGSILGLLLRLPALRSGRINDWTDIRMLRGQEITIRTRRQRSVNADGEIVTRTPATFRILQNAVTVYTPS